MENRILSFNDRYMQPNNTFRFCFSSSNLLDSQQNKLQGNHKEKKQDCYKLILYSFRGPTVCVECACVKNLQGGLLEYVYCFEKSLFLRIY